MSYRQAMSLQKIAILLLCLTGILRTSVAAEYSRRERRAFMLGDVSVIRSLVEMRGWHPDEDESQRSAVHYLLEGRQMQLEGKGGLLLKGDHELCIEVLAQAFPRALLGACPLHRAIVYRNAAAVRTIVSHSPPDVLATCLAMTNWDGEHVLHLAARSHGSGFGRFFLRHNHSLAARANGHVSTEEEAVWDLLQIIPPKPSQRQSLPAVHAALGLWDLRHLLEVAVPRAGEFLNRTEFINGRNRLGEAALDLARRAERPDAVAFLLRHGASSGLSECSVTPAAAQLATGGLPQGLCAPATDDTPPAASKTEASASPRSLGLAEALRAALHAAAVPGELPAGRGGWRWLAGGAALAVAQGLARDAEKHARDLAPATVAADLAAARGAAEPVVVAGARELLARKGPHVWAAFSRWTRKGLLHRYGLTVVQTGRVVYGRCARGGGHSTN